MTIFFKGCALRVHRNSVDQAKVGIEELKHGREHYGYLYLWITHVFPTRHWPQTSVNYWKRRTVACQGCRTYSKASLK